MLFWLVSGVCISRVIQEAFDLYVLFAAIYADDRRSCVVSSSNLNEMIDYKIYRLAILKLRRLFTVFWVV